jgi:ubiquinone/menaquinone biosynthesis C-methylase UbiE
LAIGYKERMARQTMNLLVNDIFERKLAQVAKQWSRGRLLDIGCGTKPYTSMFSPYVDEHVGVDREEGPHGTGAVDLFGTAYEIPVPDQSFDTVLCTFVLEHLEEPKRALEEAHRVLRPGGAAIYAAPFIWHLHEEPRDFFRFSKYGLQYLFEEAGFTVCSLEPLAGFWVTVGQLSVYYLYRFRRGPLRSLPLIPAVGLLVQFVAGVLDRFDRADAWTWAYVVVATRPAPPGTG